jgi:four helix bundle protein
LAVGRWLLAVFDEVMNNYKQLDAWKTAMMLVAEIYKVTKTYPKEEVFALTSQTKRAAVSVPANIAEGIGRQYKKDTVQFLHIARGSLYELETLLVIALNTNILQQSDYDRVIEMWQRTVQLLNGLINYFFKTDLK